MTFEKLKNAQELEKEKKIGALVCNAKPIMVWLESTSRCNLKCITCPRTHLPFFKGRDLDSEVFEIVKKELFPYSKRISLHSFGEPMIAANFEYFFEEAIKNNINVSFSTNGMCLTEKWLRKFLTHGIRFGISLDGAREKTLQNIRRGVNLKKIIDSVKHFNKLKEKEYKDTTASIYIRCVVLRSNIEELPEVVTLAKSLSISDVRVQHFNLSIHPLALWGESLRYYKKLANKYFMLAKKKAEELGVNLKVSFYDIREDERAERVSLRRSSSYRFPQKCFIPWKAILVRINGDITPCCGSGEIMGNIKKDGFGNVWNGAKYRNFRRRINTNLPPLDCRNCAQPFGVSAGNAENTKHSENLGHKVVYFFEHKRKLLRYIYHYLRDYL